jgi:predicted acylesterase/phospholipase RssA
MPIIKNLALAGGGIYGYSAVGALKQAFLISLDKIRIQEIAATSVGSIIGTLYAIGYTLDEIEKIMYEFSLEKTFQLSFLGKIYNLWYDDGIHDGKEFEQFIEDLIEKKTGIQYCTFEQLDFKLTLISTNLNYQKAIELNRTNTPKLAISKAVRMSSAFPLFFTPVEYEGDLYSDGGATNNYPINYFKNLDETFGICFSLSNESYNGTLLSREPINDRYEYYKALIMSMSRVAYTQQLTHEIIARSIVIKINSSINSMDMKLSNEQKILLFKSGIDAAIEQMPLILSNDYVIISNIEKVIDTEPSEEVSN